MKLLAAISTLFLLNATLNTKPIRAYTISGFAQGTTYNITYYAHDSLITKMQIDSIFNRLDSSVSIYKPYSLISKFNNSNTGIVIDQHLFNVIDHSLHLFAITGGAFDITVFPLVKAWGFHGSQKEWKDIPDSPHVATLLRCTGSQYLQLSKTTFYLRKLKPCIQIDINGIGQGYSVDVISNFLDANGIKHYLIETGGEIRIKGRKQPGNHKMQVGIETPGNDPFTPTAITTIIEVENGAITTSGSYRRNYHRNGIQYMHIIDPQTGYPARNELLSITVYAKDAATADGYDNALMVMGLQKALIFSKANNVEAYFIYRTTEGKIKDTATAGFYKLIRKEPAKAS